MKKNGKFYSSPIPLFLNNFSLTKENLKENQINTLKIRNTQLKIKQCLPLLLKSSDLIPNKIKENVPFNTNLTGLKFLKYPFNKSIGIHSITEDYFEQEVNSVYCKNGEFIEKGEVIGLLNFEKEITGDIVQGLPRIEELLEARKKKPTNKHLATNQKKSLLIQKTSIDSSFEFQKLGTTIKENDKINPHNLLKIYFNYYGIKKQFFSSKKQFTTSYRLANNYEASYRTFKKIQLLILNAVQSVYQSQGVSIANKHLEVIIKQMTTKVLITHEGHTPLLPREVVDLYHIQYINQIIEAHNKRPAYYVPLLLGITKAALNNPSFISAASFQETTRVLTKAAIEGRVDWLRGLKENIIIGHLIPSGTGYQSYTNCFNLISQNKTKIDLEKIKIKI
jgi:DNA-directed RNA polymerase subunit beta'